MKNSFPINVKTSVTEINGSYYNTVTIGTQTWMAENLNTIKYSDDTDIPVFTDKKAEWGALTTPAVCWYKNDINNRNMFGVLYNWHSVNTGKLCPTGWHVPLSSEWDTLTTYLGGNEVAGKKLKESGTFYWKKLNEVTAKQWGIPYDEGTNESKFRALPSGERKNDGTFSSIGDFCYFWSATENNVEHAYCRELSSLDGSIKSILHDKQMGISVRCLKDK